MDAATAIKFHVALICDTLPDLPGSMVVKTLRAQSPDTIAILYSRPGTRPGRAEVIEGSGAIALVPEFQEVGQLLERLDDLKLAHLGRSRERRYLAAFRQQHYEILRRFADLKQKLKRAK
jgi:hypothetical protein